MAQPTINPDAYPPPEEDELPPPYREDKPISPDDNMPPTTFILVRDEIYTYPPVTDFPPAYKLTRVIHVLGRATQAIDVSRVDSQVRQSPRTGRFFYSKREKQLYNIQHFKEAYTGSFEANGVPYGSTRTLGELRISKAPAFHHGYRVIKVMKDAEKARLERNGEKVKETYWWNMRDSNHGRVWEWRNAKNVVVARQIIEAGGIEGNEEQHKLEIVVELPRRTVDSLVSMWCLWMWHLHIEDTSKKTWADRKRILQSKRDPSMGKGGFLEVGFSTNR